MLLRGAGKSDGWNKGEADGTVPTFVGWSEKAGRQDNWLELGENGWEALMTLLYIDDLGATQRSRKCSYLLVVLHVGNAGAIPLPEGVNGFHRPVNVVYTVGLVVVPDDVRDGTALPNCQDFSACFTQWMSIPNPGS